MRVYSSSLSQLSAEELLPLCVRVGGLTRYLCEKGITYSAFGGWDEYAQRCFLVAFLRDRQRPMELLCFRVAKPKDFELSI